MGNGSPVGATTGTVLPVAAPANTYPYIATAGDTGVTGGPNLYAVDTSGNIWVWPYTTSALRKQGQARHRHPRHHHRSVLERD